jgi:surface protein
MSFNLASTWAFNNVSNSFENVVATAGPSPNWFYSTWDTRLTSAGSSNANQIRLPLFNGGTYNFVVNWGDGTSDTITVWNQAQATHTYTTPGVYNITITGTITGFRFANTGDRLKLLSVSRWGPLRFGTQNAVFWGCNNLTLDDVADVPNMTGVTNIARFFELCLSLKNINRIGEWDVSAVTDMQLAFSNCPLLNIDISNWNTANVTTFFYMFGIDPATTGKAGVFSNNGQPGIGNWNTSKVTTTRTMFQNQRFFDQDIGTKFVTVGGTSYIAWDMSANTQTQFMFACPSAGNGFFNNGGSTSIRNWNTSNVTTMNQMFQGQTEFNQDVGTKVVTVGATSYTAWDVSKNTTFSSFFNVNSAYLKAGKFNNAGSSSIRNWNTTSATTLLSTFANQPFFNQDIGTKVVTVGATSYTAWDVRNVTTLNSAFFCNAPAIGKSGEFSNGGSTSISNWNTTRVTSLNSTFAGQASFNQNISPATVTVGATTYTAWNLTGCTSTAFAFYQYDNETPPAFNNGGSTGINSWNVSRVVNMDNMFRNATGFNQPINNWNISLVTTFGATGVTGITDGFMYGKTSDDYSSANYDALLIGWASRPVQPNRTLNFGTIKRSTASDAAVTTLTSAPNNWTIIDGGLV